MTTPSAPFADELVELAAVIRAHGLGGMVVLKPFNPNSALLYDAKQVILRAPDGTRKQIKLREAKEHSGSILCAIEGTTDRDAAEALRGSVICVTRAELPEPDEGEYYLMDLVGLRAEDEAGKALGVVEEVIEYPSVVCLKVVSDDATLEVPHTERYLLEVDVEGGFVRVGHIDELDILRTTKAKR